ncbi:MAG: hypothetical protein ACI9S8_002966 [Chlamydiales bacterium]
MYKSCCVLLLQIACLSLTTSCQSFPWDGAQQNIVVETEGISGNSTGHYWASGQEVPNFKEHIKVAYAKTPDAEVETPVFEVTNLKPTERVSSVFEEEHSLTEVDLSLLEDIEILPKEEAPKIGNKISALAGVEVKLNEEFPVMRDDEEIFSREGALPQESESLLFGDSTKAVEQRPLPKVDLEMKDENGSNGRMHKQHYKGNRVAGTLISIIAIIALMLSLYNIFVEYRRYKEEKLKGVEFFAEIVHYEGDEDFKLDRVELFIVNTGSPITIRDLYFEEGDDTFKLHTVELPKRLRREEMLKISSLPRLANFTKVQYENLPFYLVDSKGNQYPMEKVYRAGDPEKPHVSRIDEEIWDTDDGLGI